MAKKTIITPTPADTRAKFGFLTYDDMLSRIAEGKLDAYDIVFSKDKKQVFIVNENLEPVAMHSKVYVYESVEKANEELNINTDTYEGQVVSILNGDVYYGYIVNKDAKGAYYVKPLYEHAEPIDYDTLGNKPIENKTGTFNNPIILNELPTGIYNICGKYKVTTNDEKEYLSGERRLALVNHMSGTTTIKVVTADGIINFVVKEGSIISDRVVTESYLKDHGYTTEEYVDERIRELDLVQRSEINEYISNYISKELDKMIDEKVNTALNDKLQPLDNNSVIGLFDANKDGVLDFLQ